MVFFDGIHLWSPDLQELHGFASKIGAPFSWFQDHARHPHYDLWGYMARKAKRYGAVKVMPCMLGYLIREAA